MHIDRGRMNIECLQPMRNAIILDDMLYILYHVPISHDTTTVHESIEDKVKNIILATHDESLSL